MLFKYIHIALFCFICLLGEGERRRRGHSGVGNIEFGFKTNGLVVLTSYEGGDI